MALSLDGHTSGATSVTGSTYQTGTLTTSTGSGQIVACIFNNSSGVTSVRGVEKLKRTEGRQAEAAGEPMVKCAVGCAPATEVGGRGAGVGAGPNAVCAHATLSSFWPMSVMRA
jgi:hypothetical protein